MNIVIKRKMIPFAIANCYKSLSAHLQVELSDKYLLDTDDERLVSIDISPNELSIIYTSVSSLPEGVSKERNAALDNLLAEQLSPLLGQQDAEALEVYELITKIKSNNEQKALSIEADGANLLLIA
jgi:hypothetical protein